VTLDLDLVRENVAAARASIDAAAARAGRAPGDIELLAATKYVAAEDMPLLAEAGIRLVGENRSDALQAKQALHAERFTWDFIGALQSRKVRQIVALVRYVHSVASESALRELGKHATEDTRVLVEVNVAGEEGKAGIAPSELGAFVERCPVEVIGLMAMPPLAREPEDSRRWFAAARELAERHGLRELSMGTTQDFSVAVQEGATIVRVGTRLYS
jgi:PLP dependent protein